MTQNGNLIKLNQKEIEAFGKRYDKLLFMISLRIIKLNCTICATIWENDNDSFNCIPPLEIILHFQTTEESNLGYKILNHELYTPDYTL